MSSNYPPGVSDKDFENPFADQREVIEAKTVVKYYLTVDVDGETVFENASSTSEGIEEGLRKAEAAVNTEIDKLTEASMERDED